ncbi:MAG: Hpt domain-containing protein [Deltaproteobacteria bacterium]|nr:Hpt domain-containing protein [Deltaproteobacteria bacterium]
MSDIVEDFVYDSREHLSTAQIQLLDLEKDPGSLSKLNALMGTLHTIKGNSGFVNLRHLYDLLHTAESLLQTVRETGRDCPRPAVDCLFQVLDTAEAIMGRLENDEDDEVDWMPSLMEALSEVSRSLEAGGDGSPAPQPQAARPEPPARPAPESPPVRATAQSVPPASPEPPSARSGSATASAGAAVSVGTISSGAVASAGAATSGTTVYAGVSSAGAPSAGAPSAGTPSAGAPSAGTLSADAAASVGSSSVGAAPAAYSAVASVFDTATAVQLLNLTNGKMGEEGAGYLQGSRELLKNGAEGIILDMRELTSLTVPEARILRELGTCWGGRLAILASRERQPDLCRVFDVMGTQAFKGPFPAERDARDALKSG